MIYPSTQEATRAERRARHPSDVVGSLSTRFYWVRELAYLTVLGHKRPDFFEVDPPMSEEVAQALIELAHDLADAEGEVDTWFELHPHR